MPIGVESAHGFGDLCFNAGLIKAIQEKFNDEIWVATRPHCKDALYNLPWISKIVDIPDMGHGEKKLKSMGCSEFIQITQNIRFFEFKKENPNHSLIDTPKLVAKSLGINDFNQKPIFIPSKQEIEKSESLNTEQPTIAITSVYTSGQSWADKKAFDTIIEKFLPTHRILWLSNQDAPKHKNVDNMLRFTRREVTCSLRFCDIFFSVGSGFFCASMGLQEEFQPKKINCLWKDDLYRYEEPINKHKWHKNLTWIHDYKELIKCIEK